MASNSCRPKGRFVFNTTGMQLPESRSTLLRICQIVSRSTPITGYMAEKNEKEVNGMKEAHLRDAVAIIEFLAWFEKEVSPRYAEAPIVNTFF